MRILSAQPKLIVDILLQWLRRGHIAVTGNGMRSEIVNTAYLLDQLRYIHTQTSSLLRKHKQPFRIFSSGNNLRVVRFTKAVN
jgi:hypothetical protein